MPELNFDDDEEFVGDFRLPYEELAGYGEGHRGMTKKAWAAYERRLYRIRKQATAAAYEAARRTDP